MKIAVTAKHIETACRRNSHHCMIVDAIRDAVPAAQYIMVDVQSIRWTDLARGKRYIYLTPPDAQEAIIRYDRGKKPVSPFELTLQNPKTRSSGRHAADTPARQATTERARRKYVRKHGRTPRTRLSIERVFGLRRLVP